MNDPNILLHILIAFMFVNSVIFEKKESSSVKNSREWLNSWTYIYFLNGVSLGCYNFSYYIILLILILFKIIENFLQPDKDLIKIDWTDYNSDIFYGLLGAIIGKTIFKVTSKKKYGFIYGASATFSTLFLIFRFKLYN